MYENFNEFVEECESNDASTLEFWSDSMEDWATREIDDFKDEDWQKLFQNLSSKSNIWKERLVECITNPDDRNQLKVLLTLSDTDDERLFVEVINRLKIFNIEDVEEKYKLYKRIEKMIDKVNGYGRTIINEYLEKKNKSISI